eukprot:m.17046 g.17046  ORF g.17046 m.17046 type:complete len:154 (-) comp7303_c0_seq1:1964-2425(-)
MVILVVSKANTKCKDGMPIYAPNTCMNCFKSTTVGNIARLLDVSAIFISVVIDAGEQQPTRFISNLYTACESCGETNKKKARNTDVHVRRLVVLRVCNCAYKVVQHRTATLHVTWVFYVTFIKATRTVDGDDGQGGQDGHEHKNALVLPLFHH